MGETLKECDQLWSKLIRKRAGGRCEKCGSTKIVQAHHIIPRTNYNLRHDPENGVALCKRDHLFWSHKDAIGFIEWLNKKHPGRYKKLRHKRDNKPKHDYTLVKIYLQTEINKLKRF